MITRTYALWGSNRKILVFLLVLGVAVISFGGVSGHIHFIFDQIFLTFEVDRTSREIRNYCFCPIPWCNWMSSGIIIQSVSAL